MTKSQRLRRVLWAAGLLGAFCAVLALLRPPCPLLALTGLYCPACGISRMFRALLRLDMPAAWRYNPAVLLLLGPLAAVLASLGYRYVVRTPFRPARWHWAALWAILLILLVFGVLRNLPMCAFLRPPS